MASTSIQRTSKGRIWTGRTLRILVTLALAGSGLAKLIRVPIMIQSLIHAGIPDGAIVPIAILELTCLGLYLIPKTSLLGTLLLTGYLGGATVTNLIGRTDFVHPLVIGLMVWGGAYLRSSRGIRVQADRNDETAQKRRVCEPLVL